MRTTRASKRKQEDCRSPTGAQRKGPQRTAKFARAEWWVCPRRGIPARDGKYGRVPGTSGGKRGPLGREALAAPEPKVPGLGLEQEPLAGNICPLAHAQLFC